MSPSKRPTAEPDDDQRPKCVSPTTAPARSDPRERPPVDEVEEASDESFPASDPPAFTHTTATRDGEAEE